MYSEGKSADKLARWIENLIGDDKKHSLEDKIMNTIILSTVLVGILLFIGDLVQKLGARTYLFSLVVTVLLMVLFFISRTKISPRKMVIPYYLLLILVFIYVWYNNGGINGTSLFFFIPIIIMFPLFAKRFYKLAIYFCLIIIGIIVLMFEIQHPDFVHIIENEKIRRIDAYLTAVLVGSTLLLMLIIVLRNYNKEHQKVIKLNNSKDKLISLIAHDLKNPIGVLSGLGEVLLENHDKLTSENRKKIIESIVKSSDDTYNLLENLLIWARSESGVLKLNKTKLNVEELLVDTLNLCSESIKGKRIKLNASIEKGLYINADRNMILTIFRNFVSNAVKFTPEEGEITVSVSRKVKDNTVEIIFKDNGLGISEDAMNKLFDKDIIYTSLGTNKEKGTGFGLKLCNEFVEKHNGYIQVKSELNVGSEFKIYLPAN